jgi:membrane fusion protein (multidrug efflux system)
MAIVPLDDIWVTANFKETQLRNMRPGNPVEIHVNAYRLTYPGHVESIAEGTGAVFSLLPPENATGNYVKVVRRLPVRLRLDKGQDPDRQLRPGMSVAPNVNVKERSSNAGGAAQ